MESARIEGGCFCGAVRYRAASRPLASMVCHCQSCRRIAGAPMVAWVTFARGDFEFVRGEPRVLRSSDDVQRRFCADCGTPLSYQTEQAPDEIDITTCSLDDPATFAPDHHSWLEHDLPWLRLGDGLPQYPRSRPGSGYFHDER